MYRHPLEVSFGTVSSNLKPLGVMTSSRPLHSIELKDVAEAISLVYIRNYCHERIYSTRCKEYSMCYAEQSPMSRAAIYLSIFHFCPLKGYTDDELNIKPRAPHHYHEPAV